MMTGIRLFSAGLVLGSLGAAGCSHGLKTIPTGEWAGKGTFVECRLHLDDNGEAGTQEAATDRADYVTTLTIDREKVFGHDALVFEILSKRGQVLDSDDTETHLRLAFVELETLANGTTLYALADAKYNPDADEAWTESTVHDRIQFTSATCVRDTCGLVLQVHYALPVGSSIGAWQDTFRFVPGRVLKTGTFVTTSEPPDATEEDEEKESMHDVAFVHWVEELRPVR
jgi:hypothetical protein